MENGFPGSLQIDTHAYVGGGGETSMFGALGMGALHGRGLWDLQS